MHLTHHILLVSFDGLCCPIDMFAAMTGAFPANAACFLGMEVAKKLLAFLD